MRARTRRKSHKGGERRAVPGGDVVETRDQGLIVVEARVGQAVLNGHHLLVRTGHQRFPIDHSKSVLARIKRASDKGSAKVHGALGHQGPRTIAHFKIAADISAGHVQLPNALAYIERRQPEGVHGLALLAPAIAPNPHPIAPAGHNISHPTASGVGGPPGHFGAPGVQQSGVRIGNRPDHPNFPHTLDHLESRFLVVDAAAAGREKTDYKTHDEPAPQALFSGAARRLFGRACGRPCGRNWRPDQEEGFAGGGARQLLRGD